MNQSNKVILDTSDEAAKQETMTLWVSRNGRAYKEEHMARYDGCTHRSCATEGCGGITEKHYLYCILCREKRDRERYLAKPFLSWDGKTPLVLRDSDEYFFDEDAIDEYCEEHDLKKSDLEFEICKPQHARTVDPADIYDGDLPDESDVPDELQKAFDELNKKILEYVEPLSWVAGQYRTKLED
jgi:hypothetical protein